MTRNAFLTIALIFTAPLFATAESPIVQGLAGAGRAGIAKEALFTNPASAALLKESFSSFIYVKPSIPEWNAGGRGYALSVYDGATSDWKGAFANTRTSRARIENGQQTYEDRSDLRFTLAHMVTATIAGGAQVRYITKRAAGREEKFFQGDVGAIFPLFSDLRAGLAYENVREQAGDKPPTLAAGLHYPLGYGFEVYGDGYRQMKGLRKGDRGWALGVQTTFAGDFTLRAGRLQDGYRRHKGWAVGGSWAGPRASIDYAMRTVGPGPRERDHIIGMNILF